MSDRGEGVAGGPSASGPRLEREKLPTSTSDQPPGPPRGHGQQRQHEAQAAFVANSEIMATTPRRTAWMRERPLSTTSDEARPPARGTSRQEDGAGAPPRAEKTPEGGERQPSLAIGSIDVKRLGAREAARRHMLQWDRICELNRARDPGSLEAMDRCRAEAKRVYEELCASERQEDILPENQLLSYQTRCIQARTALLWKTLLETPEEGCEPMKANITAALNAYETGVIGFSDTYSLIYAGRIVDTTCRTYAEFTIDRQRRLDRYLEQHGPGCLWWEPPLARGKSSVLAKKCTALDLDREDDSLLSDEHLGVRHMDDSSHFKVPMGFKRDNSLTCRFRNEMKRSVVAKELGLELPRTPKRRREQSGEAAGEPTRRTKREKSKSSSASSARAPEERLREARAAERKAIPPPSDPPPNGAGAGPGPALFFDMLLDSGAELPILLHQDFELLGYAERDMNAATAVELSAAAGQTSAALCFELLAGLELGSSRAGRCGDHAAYSEARFLPTRVIKLPPAVEAPAHGAFSGDRLSGMLPFLAYYCASAPGNGQLWLGERRAEVLTAENMPAGLVYDPYGDPLSDNRVRRRELRNRVGALGGDVQRLRKVTIESELEGGKRLVDQDVIDRAGKEVKSTIRLLAKNRSLIGRWNQDFGKSEAG